VRFRLNQRKRAYLKGRWGEKIAALYLRLKGYNIIETRFKTPMGEIDLLARKGRALIAVEVKSRSSLEQAAFAVTPFQMRRIERALLYYLSRYHFHRHAFSLDLRFDVVLIAPMKWPHHIKGAWYGT